MKTGEHSLGGASCKLDYLPDLPASQRGLLRFLTHLHSANPGRGEASALMRSLCAQADEQGISLMLNPRAEGKGLTTEQLAEWYARRFGFFTLQVEPHLMVRLPYETQPVSRVMMRPVVEACRG